MSGVLITGGSGFLGQGLARRLLDDGCDRVCVFSRGEYAQARMRAEFGDDERLRWFIGDVRDLERLERACESVDVVIHAAALKRIEVGHYCPDEMVKTNVAGSMNVIEAARRAGVRRVVLVSSDKAFEPVSPYGQSKALAESLFLAANRMSPVGPSYGVCRYGNVAGSTGSVIPTWREQMARGRVVRLTDPDATRFWMSRDEAVELVLKACWAADTEIHIPKLPAFRLGDLAEAMGACAVNVVGLGRFEKKHETLTEGDSSDQAPRLSVAELRDRLREAA